METDVTRKEIKNSKIGVIYDRYILLKFRRRGEQ